jgi:hypothetical protein
MRQIGKVAAGTRKWSDVVEIAPIHKTLRMCRGVDKGTLWTKVFQAVKRSLDPSVGTGREQL